MSPDTKQKAAVGAVGLVLGVAAFLLPRQPVEELNVSDAAVEAQHKHEGFRAGPYIPTQGDVPTIGYGSTVYENGQRVTLQDAPITKQRALQIARNHRSKDEAAFRKSIPGVMLYQGEYDLYLDFVYQYGLANWQKSSMRTRLIAGDYIGACKALPAWRRQAGRDCALPQNWGPKGCKGVWLRQQQRYSDCMDMQGES